MWESPGAQRPPRCPGAPSASRADSPLGHCVPGTGRAAPTTSSPKRPACVGAASVSSPGPSAPCEAQVHARLSRAVGGSGSGDLSFGMHRSASSPGPTPWPGAPGSPAWPGSLLPGPGWCHLPPFLLTHKGGKCCCPPGGRPQPRASVGISVELVLQTVERGVARRHLGSSCSPVVHHRLPGRSREKADLGLQRGQTGPGISSALSAQAGV